MFVIAVSAIAVIPSESEALKVMFALIGKYAVSTSWSEIAICSSELYPTVIRNTGSGADGVVARTGSIRSTTNTSLKIRQIKKPTEIFGQKLSKKYLNWHASDVSRLQILHEFGGIYLDIDMYIVKSLDVFRKFELTFNRDSGEYLSSRVIIASKNARFLKLWIEAYRHYEPKSWGKTIQEIPTLMIIDVSTFGASSYA